MLNTKVDFGLVIVDVCLNSADNILLLRNILVHKSISNCHLLCLVRDMRHITLTQARALGSSVVVSFNSDRSAVLAAAKRLLIRADVGDNLSIDQRVSLRRGLRKADMALMEIFNAASCGGRVSNSVVLEGGNAILATIEDASIGAWVDLVRRHDDVTYQHCLLVAGLSAAFGQQLGFSINDRQLFVQATLLHDLGKSTIPPSILNKPGKLTPVEFGLIKSHPVEGHDILYKQGGFDRQILAVVRHHHEYLDGSGYPDGLHAPAIPDLVRLTTICDIFAALIERRSYKSPIPAKRAFSIMNAMDNKLDMHLLKEFSRVTEVIP